MQIFIAHSESRDEEFLSAEIALWLRDHGHTASTGEELCLPLPLEYPSWTTRSFNDEYVHLFVQGSDILLAVCLEHEPKTRNVFFEIGYFRGLPNKLRVIIVRGVGAELPEFLREDDNSIVIEWSGDNRTDLFRALMHPIQECDLEYRKRRRQVFLSYSRDDIDKVYPLYRWLNSEGYNVWFDREKLVVGDDWDRKIIRAIHDSVAFIACFSKKSVNKRGYFQKELRRSLDVASEHPAGAIYILPARLDDCEVPEDFGKFHWCDVDCDDAYRQLAAGIERALEEDRERD